MTTTPVNGFDHQTAVDDPERHRHFAANVQQILREDYRLRSDEADLAFGRYLRRQTRWVTPDEAAYDAYRWWTPTVEPSVVLAREAEQLAHARTHLHDIASEPTNPEIVGDDTDRPRRESVEADITAAESALAMIRGQGNRHGFTGDQAQLIQELRHVLDESPVWETITPGDPAPEVTPEPLEPALQPETVRSNDGWDDIIALDASFAGRTITVLRPPGPTGSYVFLADTPGQRSTKHGADTATLGMIAAGDSSPDPGRAAESDALGRQVRRHLIGLVDAVADARELRTEQESRRLQAAQANLGSSVEAASQRRQPTRGTGR